MDLDGYEYDVLPDKDIINCSCGWMGTASRYGDVFSCPDCGRTIAREHSKGGKE